MSKRLEDMSYDELFRLLTWHIRRGDSIGDLKRAQEAQDEIWKRYSRPTATQLASAQTLTSC